MVEGILSSNAHGGIVDQHAGQEINGKLISVDNISKALGRPDGEGILEVRHRGDSGPNLLVGGSKNTEDAEKLINLAISGEEGVLSQHLSKDAAQAPNIDGSRVVASAKQNFGGTVPQGDDLHVLIETRSLVSSYSSGEGLRVEVLVDKSGEMRIKRFD